MFIKSFIYLLLVSLLLSTPVHAEQYVCAYKCYYGDKLCQTIIQRTDDGFKDQYAISNFTVAEDERNIALSQPYAGQDGPAVFSVIIDKETLEFSRATTDMDGSYHRNGNCTLLP